MGTKQCKVRKNDFFINRAGPWRITRTFRKEQFALLVGTFQNLEPYHLVHSLTLILPFTGVQCSYLFPTTFLAVEVLTSSGSLNSTWSKAVICILWPSSVKTVIAITACNFFFVSMPSFSLNEKLGNVIHTIAEWFTYSLHLRMALTALNLFKMQRILQELLGSPWHHLIMAPLCFWDKIWVGNALSSCGYAH